MSRPSYLTVPWTTTGTKSNPVHLDGNQLVGFVIPATIASSAMTFNMTTTLNVASSVAWNLVKNSSGTITFPITSSTSGYYGFTQDQTAAFAGVEIFQMVAASSEAANQAISLVILPRPSI